VKLTELIEHAPWREATTYRETWPHEYVLLRKDSQRELLEAICERLCNGEGVPGRFFAMRNQYLFIGDYKPCLTSPQRPRKQGIPKADDAGFSLEQPR
jgi:hypothetical protein